MKAYHVRYKQVSEWYDAYFQTEPAAEKFVAKWPWDAELKGAIHDLNRGWS